jgi:acyl carrier protein
MIDHRARLLEFLASLESTRVRPADNGRLELDSLALVQVIAYLELHYSLRLADYDIEPDDLRSADGIVGLIERCTDAGNSPAA